MVRRVAVVPHTHWDREWYEPFERFRLRLVAVLDEVFDRLETDDQLPGFLLDGQMAMVDDYLELRPEARPRVAALGAAGRISLGPWYVLMDEFCVSGETIVRNLQLGLERAAAFGTPMPVGYLPDMFGHIAQMPQLLRLVGIGHAVVWRGVPSAIGRCGFWWRSPDGSTVRAEYLPVGYGVGAHLPTHPEEIVRRVEDTERELQAFLQPSDPLLLLNGTDHQPLQPHVPTTVEEADAAAASFDLTLVRLPDHLVAAPTDGLPAWTGELRSAARANLLPGVLSNRTDVKQATATVERSLERVAEPLAALWLTDRDAGPVLGQAWSRLIVNSAHDSIGACSADEVGRAVLARVDEAAALAAAVTDDAFAEVARRVAHRGPVVINASPRTRSGMIEVVVAGPEAPEGSQVLERWAHRQETRRGVGADLLRIIGELRRDGWLGDGWGTAVAVSDVRVPGGDPGLEVTLRDDRAGPADPALEVAVADAFARAGAGRDRPLQVCVDQRAATRVACWVGPVPGYGWSPWQAAPVPAVRRSGPTLDNELIRIEVDTTTATFSVAGADGHPPVRGLGRLVDEGDDGDTYNYSPPDGDQVVDHPYAVEIHELDKGPIRARLALVARYRWPARISAGIRHGSTEVAVRTVVELRAGERFVRVAVSLDNPARDHRLRVHFPLPHRAVSSEAECAFGTVTRPLTAEGGPGERAMATYPSRRFVSAGGLTVGHEGLLEYEVVDGGRTLALTALRSTGVLSKPAPAYRPNPAGPARALRATQMVGPVSFRYVVGVDVEDPYALVDDAWNELLVADASGEGTVAPGSRLTVTGVEVSALRPVADEMELRVFNPTDQPAAVRVPGHSGAIVDLGGQQIGTWAEEILLAPHEIATLRFPALPPRP